MAEHKGLFGMKLSNATPLYYENMNPHATALTADTDHCHHLKGDVSVYITANDDFSFLPKSARECFRAHFNSYTAIPKVHLHNKVKVGLNEKNCFDENHKIYLKRVPFAYKETHGTNCYWWV